MPIWVEQKSLFRFYPSNKQSIPFFSTSFTPSIAYCKLFRLEASNYGTLNDSQTIRVGNNYCHYTENFGYFAIDDSFSGQSYNMGSQTETD